MTPQPATVTPPSAMWAQNKTSIFFTFNIECANPAIQIEKDSLYFKGICGPEKIEHEVKIPLYKEIKPSESKYLNRGRKIEVLLVKEKEDDCFWPTLTNDQKKHHWLKVDFNRWIDEDDSENEYDKYDFCPDFDDKLGSLIDRDESESEDEDGDLPDLE